MCHFISFLLTKYHIKFFISDQKTRSTLSPSKSSVEGLDAKTADLQQRARTLLEKRFCSCSCCCCCWCSMKDN